MDWLYAGLTEQLSVGASQKTFFDTSGNIHWSKGMIDDGTTYVELAGSTAT